MTCPTRNCDMCAWGRWGTELLLNPEPFAVKYRFTCDKGHRPRYYQPKGPMDENYGYKRRCDDYREETW